MKANPRNLLSKLKNASKLNMLIAATVAAVVGIAGYAILVSQAATIRTSVKSGSWSDASVWGGTVPQTGDMVTIEAGHTVTLDVVQADVGGAKVAATGHLKFDPDTSATLRSTENIVVEGLLTARPANPDIDHMIKFLGINESDFVGGGMEVLDSDVGLWVMDNGQLNLHGSERSGWHGAAGAIPAGATSITLDAVPTGWRVGDELIIAPTRTPTDAYANGGLESSYDGFDEVKIAAINGATITLDRAVPREHPKVNNQWTAEIMNLTRNVKIEGTDMTHRSHVFIHSQKPQFVNYTAIRFMGPQDHSNPSKPVGVLGRYGLHFHHSMDGSRGSQVEGTVVRDTGAHAFVPHESHGVTMRDSIAYDTFDDAFWWDPGDESHDTVWDHNIAAKIGGWHFRLTGFFLGKGFDNSVTDSVGVGIEGGGDGGGFFWDNGSEGIWHFDNNIGHNNAGRGIDVWQNAQFEHPITNFVAYHNSDSGIQQGAYVNDYQYRNVTLYGNLYAGIDLLVMSRTTAGLVFDGVDIDGAGISPHAVTVNHSAVPAMVLPEGNEHVPVLFKDVSMSGYTGAAISMREGGEAKWLDFVDSVFDESKPKIEWTSQSTSSESVVRLKQGSNLTYSTKAKPAFTSVAGTKYAEPLISPFYGTGTGLKVEYYNNPDFTDLAYVDRVEFLDRTIQSYRGEEDVQHYSHEPTSFSVRWSGQIEPQFTEEYTFDFGDVRGNFHFRLFIDGEQIPIRDGGKIVDTWKDHAWTHFSGKKSLVAGQKVDIVLEYKAEAESEIYGGMSMVWDSPSQWKGFIPTAQMYPIASDYASVVGKPAPELSDNTPVIATPPEEPASDSPAHDHDSEAPSTPGNLRLVSKDYAEINIEWDASTDNIGVDKYKVYRDGVVVATSSGPNLATIFTDITVNPAITYKYRVRALDTVGNESNFSNELSVTTSNSPQPEPDPTPDPEPTPEPEQKLGDLNGDDKVNILDLSVLLSNWNRTTGNLTNDKADLNGDDKVNILDLSVLLSRWGS